MMVKNTEEQADSIKIALRTGGHAGGLDRSRILEADDAVGRSTHRAGDTRTAFSRIPVRSMTVGTKNIDP